MRIAIAGKGGVGKTTIAATLARLEARAGASVLAIDGDSNPNLAFALGVHPDAVAAATFLPSSIVSRRIHGPALAVPLDDVIRAHAIVGPDAVRVLLMGMPAHADEGCLCSAHASVSAVLSELGGLPDAVAVLDLEASPEHLSRGTARHADVLLLVTEPYYRSLETVRRLAVLARELPIPRIAVVVNKVRSEGDAEAVAEFCDRHGLDLLARVPWSDDAVEADRTGRPLLDASPDSPAVSGIAELATRLRSPADLDAVGGP